MTASAATTAATTAAAVVVFTAAAVVSASEEQNDEYKNDPKTRVVPERVAHNLLHSAAARGNFITRRRFGLRRRPMR